MRATANQIPVAEEVLRYAMILTSATHPDSECSTETAKKYVRVGASPRAGQAIISAAKVMALIKGRLNVAYADINELALPVLRHRIKLNFEAIAERISPDEIIRRITRYATRISEMASQGSNRREEYRKLSEMFEKCRDMGEAHRLAAMVFGIEKPLHLKGGMARETDSINSGVYEEPPFLVTLTPRVRTYKEKAKRTGVIDRSREKEELKAQTIRRLQEERRLLGSYIRDGRLAFEELPKIGPQVRDIFLLWLSRALERTDHRAKTEDGQIYYLEQADVKKFCTLQCTDGSLRMPAYTLIFEEEKDR